MNETASPKPPPWGDIFTSPLLVSRRETRRALGEISDASLRRLVQRGVLRPVRLGGRTLFRWSDLVVLADTGA